MKKIFQYVLLLTIFMMSANSFAQPWYITRGTSNSVDVSWGLDVDNAGNIYWAVEEKNPTPNGFFDINLYKIDQNAQEVWHSAPFGGPFNDVGFIVKVYGQNVYVAGRQDSNIFQTLTDPLVLSYNTSNGGLNWSYIYNPSPDYGYEEIDGLSIQPDGIYFTGWTQGPGTNNMNVMIQKISLSGTLDWANTWDYDNLGRHDGANGHLVMDDNYIYIAAHVNRTDVFSADGDGALVCFNRSNGAYQWDVTWGGSSYDDALGLTMSSDSLLYMVGHTPVFGSGQQVYLNKYTRSGQLKWSRIWGGTGSEISRALATDGDSIIYVAGTTTTYGNGGYDIFVLKYDTAGTLIDSLFWGGTRNEVFHDVVMLDDYLYIVGETKSFTGSPIDSTEQAFLLKINGRTMQAPDSTMTGIIQTSLNEHNLVNIYPNPFSVTTTLEITNGKAQNYDLKIYNIFGNIVFEKYLSSNQETLNMDLLGGMYFLQVSGDNFFQTKKIEIIK
jgi:hypothetical protein